MFSYCISLSQSSDLTKLKTPGHSVVLVLTGFDHREDSHSIWPVRMGSCVGAVPTTQSSQEIRKAQAQTAIAEVRGQPLRYSLWAELPENDSVVTQSL